MKKLTTAEEQIMHILWDIKKGFVKNILLELDDPKPAYNTVSTILRILEKKGFVDYTAYGKSHEYYPLITKSEYAKSTMSYLLNDYFSNSFKNLVSFAAKEEKISIKELENIIDLLKNEDTLNTNDHE